VGVIHGLKIVENTGSFTLSLTARCPGVELNTSTHVVPFPLLPLPKHQIRLRIGAYLISRSNVLPFRSQNSTGDT